MVTLFFSTIIAVNNSKPAKVTSKILHIFTPAHALGAFCGSVPTQLELQQWQSHIAAKKRRQRRCMSEAQRP
jgi:hypothetical protein